MKAASTCEKSESHLYYLLNYDSEDVEWPAFSGGADQLMWSGLVGGRKTAKMLNGVRFLLHLLKIVLRKLQRTCVGLNLACLQRQKEMALYLKHVFPSAFACFSHYSEFHQITACVPVVGRTADQGALRLFPPHPPEPR